MRYAIGVLVLAGAAFGQQYEIGANVGYGWYRNGTIFSDSGTVQAGIRNRFAAGIVLGYEFEDYVSGEFRYLYHDGHPFLGSSGSEDRYAREFAGSHARVAVPLQAS